MRLLTGIILIASVLIICVNGGSFKFNEANEPTINRVIRQISFGGRKTQSSRTQANFRQNSGNPSCKCQPISKTASCSSRTGCTQADGTLGACCVSLTTRSAQNFIRLFVPQQQPISLRNIDNNLIPSGEQSGADRFQNMQQLEQQNLRIKKFVGEATPERSHLRQQRIKQENNEMNDEALQVTFASQEIARRRRLTPEEAINGLPNISLRGTPFERFCPVIPRCNSNAKYRSSTGACNNLFNPLKGKSNTPVIRLLPPTYEDGVFEPRSKSIVGGPLPNPRVIANRILVDVDNPDQDFTLSVMQIAQFVDHDLALSPFPELEEGEGIECCTEDRRVPPPGTPNQHELCDPIPISPNDGFYKLRRVFCLNFVRSMLALNETCTFGPAEQIEVLTHWIDGSNIYGSDEEDINALRVRRNGLLRVSAGNLLPFATGESGECMAPLRGARCFLAGEGRVQEQPALTVVHTLWHRQHNRVALELQRLNPHWSDEEVFQEARRFVIAQYQHIVYEEWLPIILGPSFIEALGINGPASGFSTDYDPSINPNTGNEFATAAFRFGHTLVQGIFQLQPARGPPSTIQLRDHFQTAHILQEDPANLDNFIRALALQPIQTFDSSITGELSNHLFQTPRFDWGMDLMTLNIERGRDHGIATYNDIRAACGLPRATDFNDLDDQISPILINRLRSVYKSVNDIDFFVGGIIEKPIGDGLVGATFACIIGDQFVRARRGDRFFYDLAGQPGSFNLGQLEEIRKSSWARIMCDNSDNVEFMQPLAFELPDHGLNRRVSCNSPIIPTPNLQLWRGERTGSV